MTVKSMSCRTFASNPCTLLLFALSAACSSDSPDENIQAPVTGAGGTTISGGNSEASAGAKSAATGGVQLR